MSGIPDDLRETAMLWKDIVLKYCGRKVVYVGPETGEQDWPKYGTEGTIVQVEWDIMPGISPFIIRFPGTPYHIQVPVDHLRVL